MSSLDQALDELRRIWSQSDPPVRQIDAILEQIGDFNNPRCIEAILELFRDDWRRDDAHWSMLHTIEAFPDPAFVGALVKCTPHLRQVCPEWARVFYMRVLNSPATKRTLARELRGQPDALRTVLDQIFDDIEAEAPEFSRKLKGLRK